MNVTKEIKNNLLKVLSVYRIIPVDPAECYGWSGTICDGIIPRMSCMGKSYSINRAAWMSENGKIPTNPRHYIRKTCDNKACTNPRHLFISRSKGIRDGDTLRRLNKRAGRKRVAVDLPKELVEQLHKMAQKYHQTLTKYLFKRLSEVVEYEKKIDSKKI